MVFVDGDGVRRTSRKISGRQPKRTLRLGLCRSRHLSCDLAKLVEANTDVVEGKEATTAVVSDELGVMGVAMGGKVTGASMRGGVGDTCVGLVVIGVLATVGVVERLLLRIGTSSYVSSKWFCTQTGAFFFFATLYPNNS